MGVVRYLNAHIYNSESNIHDKKILTILNSGANYLLQI